MKKYILPITLVLGGLLAAQQQEYSGNVGINTDTPTENLDVNGITHANLLFLRSPGEPLEMPVYFMATSDNNLSVFNHETAAASLVNLVNLTFQNVRNQGVINYDTKISATDYIAAVRSYSLERADITGNEDPLQVSTRHNQSTTNNNNYVQGSPRMYAFVQDGTWRITADYVDARFARLDGSVENSHRFTIKLQIMVYKKSITKPFTDVIYEDLGGTDGSSGYAVPTPPGFVEP